MKDTGHDDCITECEAKKHPSSIREKQSQWFEVGGDLDDFIFYYENMKLQSER